jgi:hypothetical protein
VLGFKVLERGRDAQCETRPFSSSPFKRFELSEAVERLERPNQAEAGRPAETKELIWMIRQDM